MYKYPSSADSGEGTDGGSDVSAELLYHFVVPWCVVVPVNVHANPCAAMGLRALTFENISCCVTSRFELVCRFVSHCQIIVEGIVHRKWQNTPAVVFLRFQALPVVVGYSVALYLARLASPVAELAARGATVHAFNARCPEKRRE